MISRTLSLLRDWTIYGVSCLIPRTDTTWIFIGWRVNLDREIFSDNSKYLFLHVANNEPNIRAIWIGDDQKICDLLRANGYEAYPYYSLRGVYHSMRARYTIISAMLKSRNWRYSGGTKIVQLWHGKSLKKAGLQTHRAINRGSRFANPEQYIKFHKFIAISPFLGTYTAKDFAIPEETLLISGIPKFDAIGSDIVGAEIDLDTGLQSLLQSIRKKGFVRTILYGPTFSVDSGDPLSVINLDVFNEKLKKTNDALVISLHPKFSKKDWVPDVAFSHIFFCQGDFDKYPLLRQFDAVITDYSSLCFEFLYINKPSILFAPEMAKYQKEMGIYQGLWDVLPGPKVFTFADLLDTLDQDFSTYKEKIARAKAEVFGEYADHQASTRITEVLKSARN